MENNPFAPPDAGQLPGCKQEYYPVVNYAAMKTPETFASQVNAATLTEARQKCKAGFYFYDKEAGKNIPIDRFSFAILEVYSGISGSRETNSGEWISYFSNYVKDSRTEPFTLFEKGIKRPVATGFYQGKKSETDYTKLVVAGIETRIPEGAKFRLHMIVYWLEGDRILDLELSASVSREMKDAISKAEFAAGRNVKPDRVNLYSLCDGTAFWGFSVQKFRKADKEGKDYAGKGDLYLFPEFFAGVVKNEGSGGNPELWQKCHTKQAEIRANYEAEVERRKRFGDAQPPQVQPEKQDAFGADNYARPQQPAQQQPAPQYAPAPPSTPFAPLENDLPDDDLPF